MGTLRRSGRPIATTAASSGPFVIKAASKSSAYPLGLSPLQAERLLLGRFATWTKRPVAACRALEKRAFDETHNLPPTKQSDAVDGSNTRTVHRITSSARSSIDCGMVMPSALAALRLTTNSNLVGCSIGSSAGLAPFRILSTYPADRRNRSP